MIINDLEALLQTLDDRDSELVQGGAPAPGCPQNFSRSRLSPKISGGSGLQSSDAVNSDGFTCTRTITTGNPDENKDELTVFRDNVINSR